MPEASSAAPEASSPSFAPGTPAEMQPPARPVSLAEAAGGIDWSAGRTAATIAGIFAGASAFLPLSVILIPISGLIAVKIYNGRAMHKAVTAGEGAKLGAVTGLAGYVLFAVAMLMVLRFWGDQFWVWLEKTMREQAAATGRDFKPVADLLSSGDGKAVMAVALMIAMFMLMMVLTTVGGALGAMFANRGQRH